MRKNKFKKRIEKKLANISKVISICSHLCNSVDLHERSSRSKHTQELQYNMTRRLGGVIHPLQGDWRHLFITYTVGKDSVSGRGALLL